jgi:ureidoacrylate peracid hydrolase
MKINPEETALIVVDPQNAFCDPKGNLGQSGVDVDDLVALVPQITTLVNMCRTAGIRDIWTRHYNLLEDRARDAHRIKPHTLRRKTISCLPQSWDSEFVDDLKALITPETMVLEKYRWSVFYGTQLDPLLRSFGTKLIVFCGSTTNSCIETSIRDAYMRDYDVVIVRECVAGVRSDWHAAALEIWDHYIGDVVTLSEFEEMLPD